MERRITGFHQDEHGDWVAELDCAHEQHVRHNPPWWQRPWVLQEQSRLRKLGAPLQCRRCDALEFPDRVKAYKKTKIFDHKTVPTAFLNAHSTKPGVWGKIHILSGSLRYRIIEPPLGVKTLTQNEIGIVPPEVPHAVDISLGAVEFYLEFYK